MDFSKIDFLSVKEHSNNVCSYFSNFVVYNIKDIDSLKKNHFQEYADMHNKSIDEILGHYEAGYKEGIEKAKNIIEEKNKISPDGGKFYLFEIASTYNLGAKYYDYCTLEHFKKHAKLDFNPKIIKKIGEIIGEFYYSWINVLENHMVFDPLFKKEMDKTKNDWLNKPFFPVHGVIIPELPDSMQIAKDFGTTLKEMNGTLTARIEQLTKGFLNNETIKWVFRYDILGGFKKQCFDFLQETTNNTNNGIFYKYISFYRQINSELDNSIGILAKSEPFHKMDMSFIPLFHNYKENWFVIVSDFLQQTKQAFDEISSGNIKESKDLKYLNKLKIKGEISGLKNDAIKLLTQLHPKKQIMYMSEPDIEHFVNQNFEAAGGVHKIKTFEPNMNQTELSTVIWQLYKKYSLSKQKGLWHKMYNDNFPSLYISDISNLKDRCIDYLRL